MNNTQLTPEKATEIRNALGRLEKHQKSNLVTPESAAEVPALQKYLSEQFSTHGPELFRAWLMMQYEYAPLCAALAKSMSRALAGQAAMQEAAAADSAAVPAKS